MTAIEIAIGATSAFLFVVWPIGIANIDSREEQLEAKGLALWIAATIGTVWFIARLWGFA